MRYYVLSVSKCSKGARMTLNLKKYQEYRDQRNSPKELITFKEKEKKKLKLSMKEGVRKKRGKCTPTSVEEIDFVIFEEIKC